MTETEICPKCGEVLPLYAARRPIAQVEREATELTAHAFLLVDAGGWLLHRCVVVDD